MKRIIHITVLFLIATISPAGETTVELPPKLAELLQAAERQLRHGKAKEAAGALAGWDGKDHALRHLLLGRAFQELSRLDEAATAYETALDMDATLRQAGVALAEIASRRNRWQKAVGLLGRYLDTEDCGADALLFYYQAATRSGNRELARELVRDGMLRFPLDDRFRRAKLSLAIADGDAETAGRITAALLRESPVDPGLWRNLAWSRRETGKDRESLAAIEAELLCTPSDPDVRTRFIAALLSAGDWMTAVDEGRKLLAGPRAETAAADTETMDLLIRAADTGGRDDLLEKWLGMVEPGDRTESMHVAAARTALRRGRVNDARKAVGKLIERGEPDAAVFLWAGHLAERAGDQDAAVVYYEQAKKQQPAAGSASLYLARLYYRLGRDREAADLVEQYLAAKPEDSAARAMLSLIESEREDS